MEDDLAGLRSKYKTLDYGHGLVKYSTLHRLDLGTWRSEELAAPDRYIRAFAVSEDGDTVATVTAPDRTLITPRGAEPGGRAGRGNRTDRHRVRGGGP